ncbi:MAG TPA: HD domain-containing protein [Trebonia sp.]|jgi:predicted HD phosphohydrolase|nr:HD domain-containing protein [Trebonia sp.]
MMLTSDELVDLIDGLAGLPYGGEAVDQRQHALQCAGQAVAAGADDELVLAAALHDIGRAESVRAEFPRLPHEQAGEAFARERVGEDVAWLIGQHVPAKRYLVAADEAYFGQLSPASVRSLERQGGPMDTAEVAKFRSHPRAEDAVALRRWDEGAKDPEDPGLPMAELLRVFDRYRVAQGHS